MQTPTTDKMVAANGMVSADLCRKFEAALRTIARYDEESIWSDDRDDAANAMLGVAREALGEK